MLGLGFGLAVIVGSTLGIGILRTPGLVAGQLPSPSAMLLVWIVGGLYTLVGAVCLAELGTMLPQEGGYYVYARRAFGDTVGFAVGWTDWLTYCSVLGYVSIGFGEFVGGAAAVARAAGDGRRRRRARSASSRCSGRASGSAAASRRPPRRVKFLAFLALVLAFAAFAIARRLDRAGLELRRRASAAGHGLRAAVRRDHLRRLAERAVFHGGRSRSRGATFRGR